MITYIVLVEFQDILTNYYKFSTIFTLMNFFAYCLKRIPVFFKSFDILYLYFLTHI